MNVCAIMATCGRHHLAERSLKFFLDQIQEENEEGYYDKYHLLIYNNSDIPLHAESSIMNGVDGFKSVQLINNNIDRTTGKPYTNLGSIYNDAIKSSLLYEPDVIVHWDDDDIFLKNHLSEGMKGLRRALGEGKIAYKPAKSWYRHPNGIELMSNTLEPSIFTMATHIQKNGYSLTTTDQHLQWVNPLVYGGLISVEDEGTPTLIYNWGDVNIPTFKTSGNAGHPQNFDNYRRFSKDHGDLILTPWSDENVQPYYNLIK